MRLGGLAWYENHCSVAVTRYKL